MIFKFHSDTKFKKSRFIICLFIIQLIFASTLSAQKQDLPLVDLMDVVLDDFLNPEPKPVEKKSTKTKKTETTKKSSPAIAVYDESTFTDASTEDALVLPQTSTPQVQVTVDNLSLEQDVQDTSYIEENDELYAEELEDDELGYSEVEVNEINAKEEETLKTETLKANASQSAGIASSAPLQEDTTRKARTEAVAEDAIREIARKAAQEEFERLKQEELARLEKERLAEEKRLEEERLAEEKRLEEERLEQERLAKEEAEKLEQERLAEEERLAQEQLEEQTSVVTSLEENSSTEDVAPTSRRARLAQKQAEEKEQSAKQENSSSTDSTSSIAEDDTTSTTSNRRKYLQERTAEEEAEETTSSRRGTTNAKTSIKSTANTQSSTTKTEPVTEDTSSKNTSSLNRRAKQAAEKAKAKELAEQQAQEEKARQEAEKAKEQEEVPTGRRRRSEADTNDANTALATIDAPLENTHIRQKQVKIEEISTLGENDTKTTIVLEPEVELIEFNDEDPSFNKVNTLTIAPEWNAYQSNFKSIGGHFSFEHTIKHDAAIGFGGGAFYKLGSSASGKFPPDFATSIFEFELFAFYRYYLMSDSMKQKFAYPWGAFLQPELGLAIGWNKTAGLLPDQLNLKPSPLASLRAGFRSYILQSPIYVEPYLRVGYPFVFGAGVGIGLQL